MKEGDGEKEEGERKKEEGTINKIRAQSKEEISSKVEVFS
jgi:hypothetical protein